MDTIWKVVIRLRRWMFSVQGKWRLLFEVGERNFITRSPKTQHTDSCNLDADDRALQLDVIFIA